MVVEKIINMPYEKVKAKIFDFNFFEHWWKDYNIIFVKERSYFYFHPINFIKIKVELITIFDNKIELSYIGGIFRGIGIWEIIPIDENNTKISYSISLRGRNWLFGLILKTYFFRWKHSKDIINLINKITK